MPSNSYDYQLLSVEEDRAEILKSGLDLAVQYRNQAKTEVKLIKDKCTHAYNYYDDRLVE